jgi:hypothetical protein
MQTKLDKFFSITINHDLKNKKCFIYDPDNYKAFFENNPLDNDILLTTKLNIKLYYRLPKKIKSFIIPKIEAKQNIPLLKSNLQKAIRRCQTQIAINSALAIIQREPIELLRRLPIIYIEDVCLMDSYSIPVWLMMAEKEHKLDLIDIDILLHIIKSLCECNIYYDDSLDYTKQFDLSHKNLQDFEHRDQLLALFYRSQYGGMKGDMKMLKNSLYYYSERPSEILQTVYDSIDYANFDPNLEILPEAIDFHPFPQMINMLVKQTNLDNNDIKMAIWFAESGLNIRKPLTIDKSREYLQMELWKIIKPRLARIRYIFIN